MLRFRQGALIAGVLLIVSAAAWGAPKPDSRAARLQVSNDLQALASSEAASEKDALPSHWKKVSRLLREPVARLAASAPGAEGSAARMRGLIKPPIPVRGDGAVGVTVHVSRAGEEERRALRSAGFEETFASEEFLFLEGWLEIRHVEAIAGLDFVTHVRPIFPPLTSTGSVTSEGDAILKADQARQTFGVDGTGVKVGVLSDSVDGITGSIASGDLPSSVQVLKAGQGTGEGTAMLEIVHDLAPGASLAFYGPGSSGDMITGIGQLVAAGARVIVDDLTFFDQPHFEEGPVARTVNDASAQDVVYVTSSGNFAQASGADRGHYEDDFDGGGSLGGPTANVHLFAPSVPAQEITVLPGAVGVVFLQWANPFGQAADDYDLYVIDDHGYIVAAGDDTQDGDDLPIEAVQIDNRASSGPARLALVVDLHSGSPRRIEMYYSRITDIDFATASGSIAGHANASGAITVGAINAEDPGHDDIAEYSSQGPCDLFFPSFVSRAKPEVTGIDGVAVTGAAGFPSPFFGTSAAAPHVAALAALMIEMRPVLTPEEVKQHLQGTAADLGAAGFDFVYGAGRADALAAVQAVEPFGTAPGATSVAAALDGDDLSITGAASDAEGDIKQAKIAIRDPALALLAASSWIDVTFDGKTTTAMAVGVGGLSGFPTAVTADLFLKDEGGNLGGPFSASFAGADPGGPQIVQVKYKRSTKTLTALGAGLRSASSSTFFEVNGHSLPAKVKVNKKGTKATIKAKVASLGLQPGPNRIRVVRDVLHSNILILNL